jgi:hypothetical protein
MDQQVLEIGDLFVLTADSDYIAAASLSGLFTLVAKHGVSPRLVFVSRSTVFLSSMVPLYNLEGYFL